MKAKSSIAKGKYLEDYIAEQIRELGLDPKATRSHGSGNTNTEKSDIWTSMQVLGQNVGIEAKNHKTIKLREWWKQAQKLESLGREPVLAFKFDREPLEDTKVVIYLDTFLRLAAAATEEPLRVENKITDPKARYALQRARDALREAMKYIDA